MLQLISRHSRSASAGFLITSLVILLAIALPCALLAQTAGEGSVAGTVTDSTGAVVANAHVRATNAATNISTETTTGSAGLYTISPLPVGTYSVTIMAKGYKTMTQENLHVDALSELAFNPVLTIGAATETVTVTTAPPVLDTENANLGVVIENSDYSELPILMSTTQQRDPTAFATLVPGAQAGSRTPLIAGLSNYQGYLYLDGVPSETINQQGDNRTVALNVSLEFNAVSAAPVPYIAAARAGVFFPLVRRAYGAVHAALRDAMVGQISDGFINYPEIKFTHLARGGIRLRNPPSSPTSADMVRAQAGRDRLSVRNCATALYDWRQRPSRSDVSRICPAVERALCDAASHPSHARADVSRIRNALWCNPAAGAGRTYSLLGRWRGFHCRRDCVESNGG